MMTSESIFVDSVPVGKIVIESQSQEIAFIPTISPSRLPAKDYASIDELRNAVIAAYQNKNQGSVSE
jgi:hypothetical protein